MAVPDGERAVHCALTLALSTAELLVLLSMHTKMVKPCRQDAMQAASGVGQIVNAEKSDG